MKVGEERSQIDKKQGNIKTDGKVIGKAGLGKAKQLTKNKANEKADYEVLHYDYHNISDKRISVL